ncbi:hypothetical protein ACVW00_004121 [Marmoricola sp. URHA0025 HA25]
MSDHDGPAAGEPAFDDPVFDELRGLLAEARVTEPVPGEVAARLDETLGSLRDQRRADQSRPRASVVVLRRRAGRVMVAAAAAAVIVAGGFGIAHSGHDGSGGGNASASRASQADADKSAPLGAQDLQTPRAPEADSLAAVPRLRSREFAADAAAAMRTLSAEDFVGDVPAPAGPQPAATPSGSTGTTGGYVSKDSKAVGAPPVTSTPVPADGSMDLAGRAACAGPAAPDAVTVPAVLDGVPVALVFRPPSAAGQLVEAWSCDGASLLASATVPR